MAVPDHPQAGVDRAPLQIGQWRVDPALNELRRGDESLRLEPKAIEVLVFLAHRAGRVVGRDELLAALWPGVVVGDDTLTQAVIKLRRALGDDARAPAYIETVSKRGYRLIAPVAVAAAASGAAPQPAPARRSAWPHPHAAVAAVVLLAVTLTLLFVIAGRPEPDRAPVPPLIAVLPFSSGGDSTHDYFSDGVTEDIVDALGRYSGLAVLSWNSVREFRGRAVSPWQVGKQFGARYVVQGSVRHVQGRLRVAVELSDADRGTLLWSQRYDGDGAAVFDIREHVVQQIVAALEVKLTRLEQQRAFTAPAANLQSYDLVLRARALLARSERGANREARALLAQAQTMAPKFADSYLYLADAEFLRVVYGWVEDADAGLRRAEVLANRVLAFDDPMAQARAHALLARVCTSNREFDRALHHVDRALAVNASDAVSHHWRGAALLWLGRIDEAVVSLEKARRLDPAQVPGHGISLALGYFLTGRADEALATVDAFLARFPELDFLHAMRAAVLAQLGKLDEARRAAGEVRRLSPFFDAEQFATRFADTRHTASVQQALRAAGL
jgi:adenylate cyclase